MSALNVPDGARLVRAGSTIPIEEPSNCALVRPVASVDEGDSSMSVTEVSISGRHRALSSRRSARLYYLLIGELSFVLDGGEPITISSGDSVIIPRACTYSLEGHATYLVLNTPAFENGDDNYFE